MMTGIQKMEKKQTEEFVKGLEEQPIVSPFEFVELMCDQGKNLNLKKTSLKFEHVFYLNKLNFKLYNLQGL